MLVHKAYKFRIYPSQDQAVLINKTIIHATIRRNPSGKYFVSLAVETNMESWPKTNQEVGIDVGLKDFAILSSGEVFENPKFLRNMEQKLISAQRILSRRVKGSSNWNKQRVKVARIHERIANCRTDYLQKISTHIVKNYDMNDGRFAGV